MGQFKEDYDKRLRRICGVSNDSLRVEETSKTVYEGYCETCYYEYEVIEVIVYGEDGSVVGYQSYSYMSDLIADLDKVLL